MATRDKVKIYRGAMVYDSAAHAFFSRTVVTAGGRITAVLLPDAEMPAGERIDCAGLYMIPGLVDVHTHGRFGSDFTNVTKDALSPMLMDYARAGTTAVMATPASATFDEWCAAASLFRDHIRSDAPGAHLLGVHFEGRYLSMKKRGAHAVPLLSLPSVTELCMLLHILDGTRVHFSVAPEIDGGEAFIREAAGRGVGIGIAHTDCTYEQAMQAVLWGAVSFTHTYNAMSAIGHRAPGCMTAALLADSAYAELICDGVHSHPAMTELLVRAKPRDKVVLITDSILATGCPDGNYVSSGLDITVKSGKALTPDGVLAGSTLTLFDGVKNCMRFTSLPLCEVLPFAAENPARMVGAFDEVGSIDVGKRADFLLIHTPENPTLQSVICGGESIA